MRQNVADKMAKLSVVDVEELVVASAPQDPDRVWNFDPDRILRPVGAVASDGRADQVHGAGGIRWAGIDEGVVAS
jgi:hypothetical protein